MLKEFLEAVSSQAVRAATPQMTAVDPTKDYAAMRPDGSVAIMPGQPSSRDHLAYDLDTIVDFALRGPGGAIWHSRNAVVLLVDDADRRDRVTLQIRWSKQIKKLIDLEQHQPLMDQRSFLFMLRTVFTPSAFPTAPKLIASIEAVKFEAGAKVESVIQRGKSSVGKELSAAATFLDAVPEQVDVSVPVYENAGLQYAVNVRCALELYPAEQRFQLFPTPGAVEEAFGQSEAMVLDRLRNKLGDTPETSLYYGDPR